jgi:hypothetical protein
MEGKRYMHGQMATQQRDIHDEFNDEPCIVAGKALRYQPDWLAGRLLPEVILAGDCTLSVTSVTSEFCNNYTCTLPSRVLAPYLTKQWRWWCPSRLAQLGNIPETRTCHYVYIVRGTHTCYHTCKKGTNKTVTCMLQLPRI